MGGLLGKPLTLKELENGISFSVSRAFSADFKIFTIIFLPIIRDLKISPTQRRILLSSSRKNVGFQILVQCMPFVPRVYFTFAKSNENSVHRRCYLFVQMLPKPRAAVIGIIWKLPISWIEPIGTWKTRMIRTKLDDDRLIAEGVHNQGITQP